MIVALKTANIKIDKYLIDFQVTFFYLVKVIFFFEKDELSNLLFANLKSN